MPTGKQKHTITVETSVKLGQDKPHINLEKRRAAIQSALHAATAALAAQTSALAGQVIRADVDGGTPPWGEVIIEPIWYEKNSELGGILREAAEVSFWE
jgi:hypothetical protein